MVGCVAIVDLGTGNLRSVWRAVNRAGAASEVTDQPARLRAADRIILPGVGNFARAMAGLRKAGLIDALQEAVFERRVPVLGICLGMEIMAEGSEEGRATGLGWFKCRVKRLKPQEPQKYKVPFIGWAPVRSVAESRLLRGIPPESEFYFLHSYFVDLGHDPAIAADAVHETPFPAVIESGNILGVQFHPERSHEAGIAVLKNFLSL